MIKCSLQLVNMSGIHHRKLTKIYILHIKNNIILHTTKENNSIEYNNSIL